MPMISDIQIYNININFRRGYSLVKVMVQKFLKNISLLAVY